MEKELMEGIVVVVVGEIETFVEIGKGMSI
jgi:hypothetical protein